MGRWWWYWLKKRFDREGCCSIPRLRGWLYRGIDRGGARALVWAGAAALLYESVSNLPVTVIVLPAGLYDTISEALRVIFATCLTYNHPSDKAAIVVVACVRTFGTTWFL